jgi:hypothetical protein
VLFEFETLPRNHNHIECTGIDDIGNCSELFVMVNDSDLRRELIRGDELGKYNQQPID